MDVAALTLISMHLTIRCLPVLICVSSTGRLADAKILKGVLAFTCDRGQGNRIIDIPMLDVLHTHRPLEAR